LTYSVQTDSVEPRQWSQWARQFADYSIYQTAAYQQNRCRMDAQKLLTVVIPDGESPVLMALVRVKQAGLWKIGYVQWGPLVLPRGIQTPPDPAVLRRFVEALWEMGVSVVVATPNILRDAAGSEVAARFRQAGFTASRAAKEYRTVILDVTGGAEAIRAGLHKGFRRDLRYAEKAGLEICAGTGGESAEVLRRLYAACVARKRFQGLEPDELLAAQNGLADSEKMDILVARLRGEAVGVHLSSSVGQTGIALLAAISDEGLECYTSFLLWFESLVRAGKKGMKLYDLGGIDPVHNPGVAQFKLRMGGTEAWHIGAMECCRCAAVRALWSGAVRVRALLGKRGA